MDSGNESAAFALIDEAARDDDVDAVNYLAWFHDEGRVVPRDRVRAAALYRLAANGGHRYAQWRLGVMLDTGDGVVEDPAEAFVWIGRAAEQGSPRAMVSMAVMYANGRGVERNYALSLRYYLAAAHLGEPHGFYGVGVIYNNGEGVPQDAVEALAWFLCSAALGDEEAEDAVRTTELDPASSFAAVERANEILAEFGIDDLRIEYESPDAEGGLPVT